MEPDQTPVTNNAAAAIEAPVDQAMQLAEQFGPMAVDFAISLALALAIFIVGKWLSKKIQSLIVKGMEKRQLDPTVAGFLGNILYALLLASVVVASLGQLGIETTSFLAILGAAGLAIGLALQGSLSNFAAGVMMIIFKPIRVGDFVNVAGSSGVVKDISIFATELASVDNKVIIVPNAAIMDGVITNFTKNGTRRVDLTFGVSYEADIRQVKQILQSVVDKDERILKDPAVQIAVLELADSSVNLVVRPWVKTADYWNVYLDTVEAVKIALDENNVSIPYPQMDVHFDKSE